jgi:hypothetical protein
MKYAGSLSFSEGKYRVIVDGMPMCNDKDTLLEALRAADSMKVVLHSLAWNGDKCEWVPLVTVQ